MSNTFPAIRAHAVGGLPVCNANVHVISARPVIARSFRPMPPPFTRLAVGLRIELCIDGKRRHAVSRDHGIGPIRDALLKMPSVAVDDEEIWGLAAQAEDLPLDDAEEARVEHRVRRHQARFEAWYSRFSSYTHDQREFVATVALAERCAGDLLSPRSSSRANARLQQLAGDLLCGVGYSKLPEMPVERLRALLPGFLRALEGEVVEFVEGGDWNWHDPSDPDCCVGRCPTIVDDEHPAKLIDRVRAARRIAEGVLARTEGLK